jgi:hypothetical protein
MATMGRMQITAVAKLLVHREGALAISGTTKSLKVIKKSCVKKCFQGQFAQLHPVQVDRETVQLRKAALKSDMK